MIRPRTLGVRVSLAAWLLLLLLSSGFLFGQNPSGAVKGQISDPSGASVPTASVSAISSKGKAKAGVVHADGTYEINGLAPGTYTLNARAKGFQNFDRPSVLVDAGKTLKIDIALEIAQETEHVQVTAETGHVSVNPNENGSALVIKGEDLNVLSDDPDEPQAELTALAGPSVGPDGGEMYVDGFTAGQLPPKADILEVRVNQNPFSAEYDRAGFGRIEITTRPGTGKFHGMLQENATDSVFGTRNPFALNDPAYFRGISTANLGGPLGKRASFFFDIMHRGITDSSLISAEILGPAPEYTPTSFDQAVRTPRSWTNVSPRLDFQFGSQNVLSARYQYVDNNFPNSTIGQLSLATQGLNTHSDEHTLQLSDTQVFSAKMFTQLRFQYLHDASTAAPQTLAPTISVLGAFTGGGNASGTSRDIQNHYELQSITSFFLGKHNLVVGGRLRDVQDANSSTANFLGTFTFPTLAAYASAETCIANGGTACPGATQLSLTQGTPQINVNLLDAALFAQEDWKFRPNMVLSLGMRWETQTGISDHSDFAPRVGFAWGLGGHKNKPPKTVLRTGFGLFNSRFPENLLLQSERFNGTTQQQFLVASPGCFPTPSLCSLSAGSLVAPTRYQVDPHLHAPYQMLSVMSVDQQISKSTKLSVYYYDGQGTHQLIIDDINAPLPGSIPLGEPQLGTRPYGNAAGNIDDYQSVGRYNQNGLGANLNLRVGNKLTLGGFCFLGYAEGNTTGSSASLIMDPYNIHLDYGPTGFDIRRGTGWFGSWNLPHRISISPQIMAFSGSPLDVTENQDLFGTGAFNARPALGSACAPSASGCNPLGVTFLTPATVQSIIPINGYRSPGQFNMNLRLGKTWGFGKETQAAAKGAPAHGRFNIDTSASIGNVFNDVNLGPRIGNLGSPLFGKSNSLGGIFGGGAQSGALTAGNRRVSIVVNFTF